MVTQPSQAPAQEAAVASDPAAAAAERTRRFVALAFCRADLLFELDNAHNIVFAAGTTQALFGKTPKDLSGQSFPGMLDVKDRGLVIELLDAAGAEGRIDDIPVHLILANGAAAEAAIAGYRVPDFNNHFFIAVKLSPRKLAKPRQRKSDRDIEAGVLTQESFGSVAADRIKSYQDAGGDAKMTMVRIENLEQMKGELSTESQVEVMDTIGGILKGHSLGGDTAGRIDEESFSFVHGADVDADAVGREIEEATKGIHPGGLELTSATTTVDADTAGMSEEQMTKALLYTMQEFSKNKGEIGETSLSSMLQVKMAETMKAVEAFKKVCETKHFDLVFMPICDLRTGKVHHLEALTRFRGGGGDASPYKLISMAEEVGIISEFDYVVAEKAIEAVEKFGIGTIPPLAVNISGNSIGDTEFVGRMHRLLARHPDIQKAFTIEITESAEIEDLEGVNATIQSFRKKGFQVALDDFGAGAASFDYLNSFDVDTVKFDGPVVKRAYATDKGKAFLASMASLCDEMGVETIAEMVEDEPLAAFLAECGVHLGQGWYFGKPDSNPLNYDK